MLTWRAPESCPTQTEAEERVAELLLAKWHSLASTVTASVEIRRLAALYEATIVVAGAPSQERVLRDADCAVLTHAITVVLALALDPGAEPARAGAADARARPRARSGRESAAAGRGAASSSPSSAPSSSEPGADPVAGSTAVGAPSAVSSSAPDEALPAVSQLAGAPLNAGETTRSANPTRPSMASTLTAAPTRDSGDSPQLQPSTASVWPRPWLGAAPLLGLGVLPGVAPGVAVSFGMDGTALRTGLRLAYLPAKQALLDREAGVGGRIALASAALDAGVRLRWSAIELPLLAGFEAGLFMADAVGALAYPQQTSLWLAGYLSSGLRVVSAAPFVIGLRVDGIIALRRPSFRLEDSAGTPYELYRGGRFAARILLEIELYLR